MDLSIKNTVNQTNFEIEQWVKQEMINDITPEETMVKFAFKSKF